MSSLDSAFPTAAATLSLISVAAAVVNVMAKMLAGFTPWTEFPVNLFLSRIYRNAPPKDRVKKALIVKWCRSRLTSLTSFIKVRTRATIVEVWNTTTEKMVSDSKDPVRPRRSSREHISARKQGSNESSWQMFMDVDLLNLSTSRPGQYEEWFSGITGRSVSLRRVQFLQVGRYWLVQRTRTWCGGTRIISTRSVQLPSSNPIRGTDHQLWLEIWIFSQWWLWSAQHFRNGGWYLGSVPRVYSFSV